MGGLETTPAPASGSGYEHLIEDDANTALVTDWYFVAGDPTNGPAIWYGPDGISAFHEDATFRHFIFDGDSGNFLWGGGEGAPDVAEGRQEDGPFAWLAVGTQDALNDPATHPTLALGNDGSLTAQGPGGDPYVYLDPGTPAVWIGNSAGSMYGVQLEYGTPADETWLLTGKVAGDAFMRYEKWGDGSDHWGPGDEAPKAHLSYGDAGTGQLIFDAGEVFVQGGLAAKDPDVSEIDLSPAGEIDAYLADADDLTGWAYYLAKWSDADARFGWTREGMLLWGDGIGAPNVDLSGQGGELRTANADFVSDWSLFGKVGVWASTDTTGFGENFAGFDALDGPTLYLHHETNGEVKIVPHDDGIARIMGNGGGLAIHSPDGTLHTITVGNDHQLAVTYV